MYFFFTLTLKKHNYENSSTQLVAFNYVNVTQAQKKKKTHFSLKQNKMLTVFSKLFSFTFTLKHPLLSRGEFMIE